MEHERENAEYATFCESARVALENEAEILLDSSLSRLSSLKSTWHPNGFAVFHLNDEHELGKLRLHIWPDAERIVRPDDAPIHSHVWHLCSHILAGTYSETLYEKVSPGSAQSSEYHSVAIDYLVDKDTFASPGTACLRPASTILANAGEFHLVPAEMPHETHIGERSFVATLLLTSNPVSGQAIMYSPEEIQTSTYHRPVLSREQKMELLSQLEHEVESRAGLRN
ncbi:hypothetical protein [Microbacterium sp. A93]|uniref:hypothetical protein n=1 Tax=Microbacterium sp. A93 TaxID=3450716 RepID=UPI003F429585